MTLISKWEVLSTVDSRAVPHKQFLQFLIRKLYQIWSWLEVWRDLLYYMQSSRDKSEVNQIDLLHLMIKCLALEELHDLVLDLSHLNLLFTQ